MSLAPSALAEHDGNSTKNIARGGIIGKYFQNEKEEEQLLRENIHDVCFWMNGEAMCENSQTHDYSMRTSSKFFNKRPY